MTVSKAQIRESVWDDFEESGVARFPFPPHGRIPNFAGAAEAADRLADQPEWNRASSIKANPDAPQLPVRRRALREGKTVYMAVPRLREEECFLRLDPAELTDYDEATTVSGSATLGEQVGPEAIDGIDLIVSGSVAVTVDASGVANGSERLSNDAPQNVRIGKGEGYSDLEYAILRELSLVDEETPVTTTIHERQRLMEPIEPGDHDVPMDLVVTPECTDRPEPKGRRPRGIDWSALTEKRIAEIPVLDRLR